MNSTRRGKHLVNVDANGIHLIIQVAYADNYTIRVSQNAPGDEWAAISAGAVMLDRKNLLRFIDAVSNGKAGFFGKRNLFYVDGIKLYKTKSEECYRAGALGTYFILSSNGGMVPFTLRQRHIEAIETLAAMLG